MTFHTYTQCRLTDYGQPCYIAATTAAVQKCRKSDAWRSYLKVNRIKITFEGLFPPKIVIDLNILCTD